MKSIAQPYVRTLTSANSDPCILCGEPVHMVSTSAGRGKMAHLACRRERMARGKPTHCAFCADAFEPRRSRGSWQRTCSKACARRLEMQRGDHSFQVKPRYGFMTEEEAAERAFARGESTRRKRRARLAGVMRDEYTTAEIAERDSFVCHLCDSVVDMSIRWPDLRSASVDHVVPLSKGGDDTLGNVRLACLGCNMSKGDRV